MRHDKHPFGAFWEPTTAAPRSAAVGWSTVYAPTRAAVPDAPRKPATTKKAPKPGSDNGEK